MEQTGRYLEESNVKVNQLTDVNAAFTSDIKIQRRIQSKYKIELEISETKRKQSESDLEEEKKRSDELTRRVKDLMLLNEEQKSETIIAQKAVEKMNRGINWLLNIIEVI